MASKELRQRAEDAMRMTRRDVSALRDEDAQRVIHELQVHQIELEMQNESLLSTQEELETSREQYRELYDSAPVAYLSLDREARVVRANNAASTLLGIPRARLLGKPLAAFIHDAHLQRLRAHLTEARSHAAVSCELQLRCENGGFVDVQLDTSCAPGEADCLMVLTDMSASKRAQTELEALNRELEAHVIERTSLLEARGRALGAEISGRARSEERRRELATRLSDAERVESHGLLAGGIAHDFNNLLVSVLGNADLLLLSPGLPDDWREPLTSIKSAARSTSDLTRQLLVYAGQGHLSMAPVGLSEVVNERLESMRKRLGSDIELRTEIALDMPAIDADRVQIAQLVTNLVTNAIEALDGDGLIIVRTHLEELDAAALDLFPHCSAAAAGMFAMLEVHDTGPGIPATMVERIFEPFFTTKFAGRGLGLASVSGIVHGHHGALRVLSTVGEGTMFEVALPLTAAIRRSDPPRPRRDDAWRGFGRALLVDDDDHVRDVLGELLAYLGFQVTASSGGQEALQLFRDAAPQFELVVLDWMMPGWSGERVLKQLRELSPKLPVVLVSGYGGETRGVDDEHAIRLQKPTTLTQLQEAIQGVYRVKEMH
jgi:PAS domain S-box-containing protein